MKNLSNYKLISKLYESNNSQVFKASKGAESRIIKILKNKYPSVSELAKIRQEFDITSKMYDDYIIRSYEFFRDQEKYIIVFEDFQARSLDLIYQNKKADLSEFLKISLKICDALESVHQKNIIHKDLNPSNIVMNPRDGKLKIIDFGIAVNLKSENINPDNVDTLEGTLAYISPEQTGRMNRSIDYRTDFYSLGISFYELMTGEKIFISNDPMEILHFHIARKVIFPQRVIKEYPATVLNIIKKLISKNPENRYQSIRGIKADLLSAYENIQNKQEISFFEAGKYDINEKFIISNELLGREKEVKRLYKLFESVKKGNSEILMVSGYSGIGKSSLINEIHKRLTETRSFVCKGKYEQFQREFPYSAIIQALSQLLRQLLSFPADNLRRICLKISEALGHNARVIIDIIPDFEKICGNLPELPELNPTESRNRFLLTVKKLLNLISTEKTPLVFLIDDLQWADNASLELIKYLFYDNNIKYFFLLATYRDNEINQKHPLMTILGEKYLREKSVLLKALKDKDINRHISLSMRRNTEEVEDLSRAIYRKAKGNPFFTNLLLKTLYEQKAIIFNSENYQWHYDLDLVKNVEVSDNVVDILLNKLMNFSETTYEIIKMAACLGTIFDLKMMLLLTNKKTEEIINSLDELIENDFINIINKYRDFKFCPDYQIQ